MPATGPIGGLFSRGRHDVRPGAGGRRREQHAPCLGAYQGGHRVSTNGITSWRNVIGMGDRIDHEKRRSPMTNRTAPTARPRSRARLKAVRFAHAGPGDASGAAWLSASASMAARFRAPGIASLRSHPQTPRGVNSTAPRQVAGSTNRVAVRREAWPRCSGDGVGRCLLRYVDAFGDMHPREGVFVSTVCPRVAPRLA